MLADLWAEIRWFFGHTACWIWGDDLYDALVLSGAPRLFRFYAYGLRVGPCCLYVLVRRKGRERTGEWG